MRSPRLPQILALTLTFFATACLFDPHSTPPPSGVPVGMPDPSEQTTTLDNNPRALTSRERAGLDAVAALRVEKTYADGSSSTADVRGPAVIRRPDLDHVALDARVLLPATPSATRGDLSVKLTLEDGAGQRLYTRGAAAQVEATFAESRLGENPVIYGGSGSARLEVDRVRGFVRIAINLELRPTDGSASPIVRIRGIAATRGSFDDVAFDPLVSVFVDDINLDDLYFEPDTDWLDELGHLPPEEAAYAEEPWYDDGAEVDYSVDTYNPDDVYVPPQTGTDPGTSSGTSGTGSSDTGSSGTGSSDTGSSGTGSSDTGSSDTGSSDTGSSDTGSSDTGSSDTGSSDDPSDDWGDGWD